MTAAPKWTSADSPCTYTNPGLMTNVAVEAMDAASVMPTTTGFIAPSPTAKLSIPLVLR